MDNTILLWINQGWANPWLDALFSWVSQRDGFGFPFAAVVLAGCIARFGADGAKLWLVLVITVGVADFTGNHIKHIAQQHRPCYDLAHQVRQPGRPPGAACGASLTGMPSNHATNFFAAALFLAYVLRRRWVTLTMVGVALCVGLSRIYLGKHYPSQVAAGILLGSAVGLVAAWTSVKYLAFIQRVRARSP